MKNPITSLSQRAKNAIHRLGYTVLRNERMDELEPVTDIYGDDDFRSIYAASNPYTMTSASRMYALYKAVEHVGRQRIPGAIVECGVWRGGSSMLVALGLIKLGVADRTLYLYDTFEGMTDPTDHDVDRFQHSAKSLLDRASKHELIWAYAALDDVRSNLVSTGYPLDKLEFVKGKVEETIPTTAPEHIAVRLDTDWYESTYHELVHLYPRLISGSVLILDDYGHWAGARKAVDQYFSEHGISMLLNRIDYTGRIGIKA
jgi:hypothetical protein